MLKSLSTIEDYLISGRPLTREEQRDWNFYDIVRKLYPDYRQLSLYALLTSEFQEQIFNYLEDSLRRSACVADKRRASYKTITRNIIKDRLLPNFRIFPDTKREREFVGNKQLLTNYTEQIKRMLSLYISKGEAIHGLTDATEDQPRKAQLSRERSLTAYALLSILLNGIGLEALANLKSADYDPAASTLTLANGVTLKLPDAIKAIIDSYADAKRTYLFPILRPQDSDKRKREKISQLSRDAQALLAQNKIDLPVNGDPLFSFLTLAMECPLCDVEALRAIASIAVWGGVQPIDLQHISKISSDLLRSISLQFTDVVKSWFCIMCTFASRTSVRMCIRENSHCPADIEFLEPTDILYRHDGKRTIPYENPFFESMLLIKCNFYEAKLIDYAVGYSGYLYGFTDADGTFHCRITQEEIDRLKAYLNINGRRKAEFAPGTDLTGAKVLLLRNPFKGLVGTVLAQDPKNGKMDVAVEIFSGVPAVLKGVSDKHIQPTP